MNTREAPVSGKQRGVALVTALLVVSLATIVAVAMATRLQVDVRRTGNLLHGEQAYAYALAAESWAEVILRRDAEDSKIDTLGENWATALPPIAVEGGFVSGRIEDLQGRFNLNNLVGADGKPSVPDLEYFKRLLVLLEVEPGLATALLDWIDADINATLPDGAEDDIYLLEDPPYRAANRPLVSTSELRLVKGFSPEIIALLAPFITALPEPTALNINTASPLVLQALHAELATMDAEQIIEARGEDGFPELEAFLALDALAGLQLDVDVDIKSAWFSVLTDVRIGRGQAQLESRLQRTGNVLTVGYRVRTRRLLP
jgi:general secretion pathway protein K